MTERPRVVLVPGLYMPALAMRPLALRLGRRGLEVTTFGYRSWARPLDEAVADLARCLAALEHAGPLHLVGHSLGGLLLLTLLGTGYRARGHLVLLGSPLAGSAVARRLGRRAAGRLLLGANRDLLGHGWTGDVDGVVAGMIAGDRPLGMGRLFGSAAVGPGDGTVAITETALDGLADRIVVPCTHTSLLLSARAALEVVTFLAHGRFSAAARRA